MISQMEAMKTILENSSLTEQHMIKAVEWENLAEDSSGPVDIPMPSFEFYGNWLVEQGRYEEALEQFENSLKRAPFRALAMQGKIAALQGLGDIESAEQVRIELMVFWHPSLTASI